MPRIEITSNSSYTLKTSARGHASQTRFSASFRPAHPIPQDKLERIRQAFKDAGFDFEYRQTQPGEYLFELSSTTEEA